VKFSYFDHNATTPVAPEVTVAYSAALQEAYGNASSIHHFGQIAKQRLEMARRQVATAIGANPKEIVFLSGGTEADNLALRGIARAGQHVITTTIEHPAVLNTCAALQSAGVEVTYIPVASDGIVRPDDIRRSLQPNTVLVSVMHANNEIGTVQPLADISKITREAGILLHSDGVQAAGKLPVNVRELGVDLYTISGHKIGAPKGVGVLFVRDKTPISAISFGGHHERERRPGTENVPGAVALARAFELGRHDVTALRNRLEEGILDRVPRAFINGRRDARIPNTTNIRFDGVEGEALLIALDLRGFAVSSGAACSSGAIEPSHVLTAIGLSRENARSSLRFSLGRTNTQEQVDALIAAVAASVTHLRRISTEVPAYV
jgi:cysteine desulfurase